MLLELDVVTLNASASLEGVPAGSSGVIVHIHTDDPPTFGVEFFDDDDQTIDVFTVPGTDLTFVCRPPATPSP